MDLAVQAVEVAFRAHGEAKVLMPPKVYLDLPDVGGDFRAMPAWMPGGSGVKWVNSHPENPKKHGLPTVMGVYILSDPQTARPLAILDGTLLTAYRTGAAAAVASKYLAVENPKTLGIIGCGAQASYVIEAHRVLWPDIEVIAADTDPRQVEAVQQLVGGCSVGSTQVACASDIVCTLTPCKTPVIKDNWVAKGTHINAMGADAQGKQELSAGTLRRARVFVDEWTQAAHSGEINVPVHRGEFLAEDLCGTLGHVITGGCMGRESSADITVFDSTGLAIQDLALARALVDKALELDVGIDVDLVGH